MRKPDRTKRQRRRQLGPRELEPASQSAHVVVDHLLQLLERVDDRGELLRSSARSRSALRSRACRTVSTARPNAVRALTPAAMAWTADAVSGLRPRGYDRRRP